MDSYNCSKPSHEAHNVSFNYKSQIEPLMRYMVQNYQCIQYIETVGDDLKLTDFIPGAFEPRTTQ